MENKIIVVLGILAILSVLIKLVDRNQQTPYSRR